MCCARCFLFLVNYARMRTEIAVKAIPVLEHVRTGLETLCDLLRIGAQ